MDIFDLAARISLDSSEYENGVEKASGKASGFGDAWGKAAKIAGAAITTVATGVGVLVKNSVEAYANYEQLVGGVETLFKVSSDKVQQYADIAYKTAGLSANEYMETVTGFSASLLQSLGGDTEKAAEVADRAIRDMSDNANKMGSDIESIKTAYAGFSKQNYTMLDNLKLGYGGTKEEMERLIKDAAQMTEEMDKLGISVDADSMSFGNIVNAISVMQEHLDIAGTTAKEAATAISGSISSAKSSWTNLITGMANENADFDRLVNEFVESVGVAADNLIPRIEVAINGIGNLVTGLAPKIAEMLPGLVENVVPDLLDAAADTIEALLAGVVSILPGFTKNVVDVLIKIVEMISDHADEFTQAAVDIVLTLVDGITNAVPKLIPAVVTIVKEISYTLIDNADKLLDAAFALIMALVDGIADNLPELVEAILMLCGKIIETFMNYDWSGQTEKLFQSVGNALTGAFSVALGAIDSLFGTHLSSWYNECKTFFFNLGVDMANALNPQAPDDREGKDISMDFRYAVNDETKRLIKAGMDAVEALKEAEKNVADSMGEAAYNSYLAYRKATEEDAKVMAEAVASEASNAAKKISTPIIDYGAQNAQAAKEAAKSVNEASLTVGGAIEGSGETVTAAIDKEADKTVKATQNSTGKKLTALEKTMQSLDHMYKTHQISEEEYWKKKESAVKKYVDKDSEAWWSAMEEVTKHYDDMAKKEAEATKKLVEETKKNFNQYMNSFSDIATEYKKKFDDLSKTISNYSSSLTGGLYSGFNKDENGKITGYTKLAEKKHKLQDYFRLLQNLKKNGLSGPLLSMFQGLSLDEGMELAKYLSGLSGSNFNDIINSWNEINNIATEIGNLLYSEQAQAIAGEMQKALTEAVGEGQFSSIGENIVNSICEGMTGEVSTSKMQAALNKLSKNVTASTKLGNASIEMYSGSLKSGGITVNQTFVSPTELTQDEAGRKAKEGVMLAATR